MNEGRNEISAHSRAKGLAPLSAEGDRINLGCSGDSFTRFLLVNRTIRSETRERGATIDFSVCPSETSLQSNRAVIPS